MAVKRKLFFGDFFFFEDVFCDQKNHKGYDQKINQ
jgi:hypothetical protein